MEVDSKWRGKRAQHSLGSVLTPGSSSFADHYRLSSGIRFSLCRKSKVVEEDKFPPMHLQLAASCCLKGEDDLGRNSTYYFKH